MPLSKNDPSLDYDGSWGDASEGWPSIHFPTTEEANKAYVVAWRDAKVPYGSYVLVDKELRLENAELKERVEKQLARRRRSNSAAREKLIRHRVPWLAEARGETMQTRVSTDTERMELLKKKLLEEVGEFIDNPSIDELIDVYAVVEALREKLGAEEFYRKEADKYRECGGFFQGVVWIQED